MGSGTTVTTVARCFRDEDLRGDRQPDLPRLTETSFLTAEIQDLTEGLIAKVMKDTLNVDVSHLNGWTGTILWPVWDDQPTSASVWN